MNRIGRSDIVSWLAGYDNTGRGQLTSIDHTLDNETVEIDLLSRKFTFKDETGKQMFTYTERGYLDDNQLSLRRRLRDGDGPYTNIMCLFGAKVGQDAILASPVGISKKSAIPPEPGGLVEINLDYMLDVDGEAYYEAKLVADGTAKTDAGVNPVVDLGVASTSGFVVGLMADSINFDGATSLTVKVEHSTTSSSGGWSDVTGATMTFTPTGTQQFYLRSAPPANLRRYVRLRWDWDDTTSDDRSVKIMGAIRGI